MPDDRTHDALLASIDPFVAMMDGRRQLLEAIESHRDTTPDLAETLGIVAAHDHALREVMLAFADGVRDFTSITPPRARALEGGPDAALDADLDAMVAARAALFEAVDAIAHALDEVVETPWGGRDSWRMHLLGIAMHDGAQAHAIIEAAQSPRAVDTIEQGEAIE